jgi:hypothetical protein
MSSPGSLDEVERELAAKQKKSKAKEKKAWQQAHGPAG